MRPLRPTSPPAGLDLRDHERPVRRIGPGKLPGAPLGRVYLLVEVHPDRERAFETLYREPV